MPFCRSGGALVEEALASICRATDGFLFRASAPEQVPEALMRSYFSCLDRYQLVWRLQQSLKRGSGLPGLPAVRSRFTRSRATERTLSAPGACRRKPPEDHTLLPDSMACPGGGALSFAAGEHHRRREVQQHRFAVIVGSTTSGTSAPGTGGSANGRFETAPPRSDTGTAS